MVIWMLPQKGGHLNGVKVLLHDTYGLSICIDTHGNSTKKESRVSYLLLIIWFSLGPKYMS